LQARRKSISQSLQAKTETKFWTVGKGNFLSAAIINIKVMKRKFLVFAFTFFGFFLFGNSVFAQKQIEQQVQRDPILEADAKHNLEVAQQYFKLKKAYKAVLLRFEETFAAYPEFSKMDEFLYYAGMSSFYLSENKGKQKIVYEADKKKFAPEKLREDSVAYLSLIKEKYPQSIYKEEAEKTLKEIQAKK
jgi:outer membrane protein assembly factor BamD (BamD/ComL family)